VTTLIQRTLEPVPGCASRLGGLYLAHLEDQTRRFNLATRDLTAEELAWQPAPGQNTIGMLIAHMARTEVDWICLALLGRPMNTPDTLPITDEEIGMPLPADGVAPALLHGKTLDYYDELLATARAFTKAAVAPLTDETFGQRFRVPWDKDELEGNPSFVLSHLTGHFALHRGQIALMRHQYRDRASA
jgi:uncharacterized damage-inducible protein DinB